MKNRLEISLREKGCTENGGLCQRILSTFRIFSSIKRKSLFFKIFFVMGFIIIRFYSDLFANLPRQHDTVL